MLFQLFGRLHPLIVHFPVGILLLAFVFEALSWTQRFRKFRKAVQPTLVIGALSSIVAVLTGLTLANEGGYDEDLLIFHRNMGIATTVISFVAIFLRSKLISPDKVMRKRVRFLALLPVVLLVSFTGHLGGSLTHGEDYLTGILTGAAEETSANINFDSIKNVDDAVMYADLVQPILEARCYSCHSSSKQKGQLRLDGIDFIKRGGKHGEVVVTDIPDSSTLYHRLILPVEDKEHMPPEEKMQLSSAEIDIIHSWVMNGSSFDKKVGAFPDHDKVREFVAAIQSMSRQKNNWVPAADVKKADVRTVEALKELGVIVIPVSLESHYLAVNFINARSSGDKEIERLLPLKDQLLWLNLEGTKISNAGMETVGKLSALRILYLNRTSIDDAGIEKLTGLQELTYLNVVGTAVSDNALTSFRKMKKLESLYVFETKISRDSIRHFAQGRTGLTTDTGRYSIPFLPTDTTTYKPK